MDSQFLVCTLDLASAVIEALRNDGTTISDLIRPTNLNQLLIEVRT